MMQPDARSRNPFGLMDVPEPNDREVMDFATTVTLEGATHDINAARWSSGSALSDPLDGAWSSRWNGGADPAIRGDTEDIWKQGVAEVRTAGERVYLRFDWDGGRRRGLIDARREGATRLIGKYINLTDTGIVRPWVGLIVDTARIDGLWTGGRLDFRR